MADQEVVIVGSDGTEHVFPPGFDPKKAAAIVSGKRIPAGPPEPDTYWAGALKGALEGAAGGAKGFAQGLATSPLSMAQGLVSLLTTNPITTVTNTAEAIGHIPSAVMNAGNDPEGWGRGVGDLTGQTMLGMVAPAGVRAIARNAPTIARIGGPIAGGVAGTPFGPGGSVGGAMAGARVGDALADALEARRAANAAAAIPRKAVSPIVTQLRNELGREPLPLEVTQALKKANQAKASVSMPAEFSQAPAPEVGAPQPPSGYAGPEVKPSGAVTDIADATYKRAGEKFGMAQEPPVELYAQRKAPVDAAAALAKGLPTDEDVAAVVAKKNARTTVAKGGTKPTSRGGTSPAPALPADLATSGSTLPERAKPFVDALRQQGYSDEQIAHGILWLQQGVDPAVVGKRLEAAKALQGSASFGKLPTTSDVWAKD